MIKTVMSSLFAVFLFALGAAGSWYFVEFQKSQPQETSESEETSPDFITAQVVQDNPPATSPGAAREMPIPVHPRSMSAEEVFRIGAMHRKNIEALQQREERLQSEEMRLQLVQTDIDAKKSETEGILKQVQSALDAGEQLLSEIVKQREALAAETEQRDKELKEIHDATSVSDGAARTNVKEMAVLLSSMAETNSARVIKELIQKGNMPLALSLLSEMGERDAAKLLDSLDDPVLLADITEQYRELTRASPNKKKR